MSSFFCSRGQLWAKYPSASFFGDAPCQSYLTFKAVGMTGAAEKIGQSLSIFAALAVGTQLIPASEASS